MSDCRVFVIVSGDEENTELICGLQDGHPGPLHHDGVDGIWWALDDAPHEGEVTP